MVLLNHRGDWVQVKLAEGRGLLDRMAVREEALAMLVSAGVEEYEARRALRANDSDPVSSSDAFL